MNRINLIFLFCFVVASLHGKIWIKEYTYNASEIDSKVSSRSIALEQVKRLLLEEIGIFINSELILEESEINGEINEDFSKKVRIISAGITKTRIIEEKWNGEVYYIKAEIEADEQDVLENLNKLIQDKEKTDQLIAANERVNEALNKISKLNKELKEIKNLKIDTIIINNYHSSINEISSIELFQNGIKAFYEQEYDKSILLNLKALDVNPNFTDAMYNIGYTYNEKGDSDLAIEYWNKTTELNPSYIKAIYNIGCIYLSREDNQNAINNFKDVIKIDPTFTEAYYNLGLAYNNQNKKNNALNYWFKTIEMDKNYLPAYNNISCVYNEQKEYKKSIKFSKKIIKIDPNFAMAYNNLAVSYQNLNQNNKAIKYLKKAAKLGLTSAQKWLEDNDILWN